MTKNLRTRAQELHGQVRELEARVVELERRLEDAQQPEVAIRVRGELRDVLDELDSRRQRLEEVEVALERREALERLASLREELGPLGEACTASRQAVARQAADVERDIGEQFDALRREVMAIHESDARFNTALDEAKRLSTELGEQSPGGSQRTQFSGLDMQWPASLAAAQLRGQAHFELGAFIRWLQLRIHGIENGVPATPEPEPDLPPLPMPEPPHLTGGPGDTGLRVAYLAARKRRRLDPGY